MIIIKRGYLVKSVEVWVGLREFKGKEWRDLNIIKNYCIKFLRNKCILKLFYIIFYNFL